MRNPLARGESVKDAAEEPPDTGERHRLSVVGGLAALSLDAMASVAYGPEAIVLVLALAGGAGMGFTLPVTLTIAALLTVLTLSYRFLPRQFARRGDRLVFSNGIIILALLAGTLIWAFDASTTRLIQLYIIGVFVSFTLSQVGMVRHWNQVLGTAPAGAPRRRVLRARAVNAVGAAFTGLVLAIVLATKFTHGAWIVCIAMPLVFLLMKGIHRHYTRIAAELEPADEAITLPSRIHAIVLVSRLHTPALQALAFARATHPSSLTAVTVRTNDADTRALEEQWNQRAIPVPLAVLDSAHGRRPRVRAATSPARGGARRVPTSKGRRFEPSGERAGRAAPPVRDLPTA